GKSSLAFDVVHAEGQRRYLEALSVHPRGPVVAPPRVDSIGGLPPTVALSQRPGAVSPRSTVGTLAELDPVLRVIFGRVGTLRCPVCGRAIEPVTHDAVVARLLLLPQGTRLTLETPLSGRDPAVLDEVARAGFGRVRVDDAILRLEEVEARSVRGAVTLRVVVDRLRVEADRKARLYDSVRLATRAGKGVLVAVHGGGELTFVDRPYCAHDDLVLPPLEPELLSPWQLAGACPTCKGAGGDCTDCGGSRLSPVARAVTWRGWTLPDLQRLPIAELRERLVGIGDASRVEEVAVVDLVRRLDRLIALSLGHLGLMRAATTLSGGELQRTRLARQVASPLAGVLYVLDEPAAGLDEGLAEAVAALLRELVDAGNTVVAVEHHAAVIRAADHLVEFGPGAGVAGGTVVATGDASALMGADTATGRFLAGRVTVPPPSRPPAVSEATLSGAWLHGASGGEVRLARQRLVVVTGPSGSGKSALIAAVGEAVEGRAQGWSLEGADGLARLVSVDRAAGRSSRANPATYVGLWDVMRDLLSQTKDAQVRALTGSAFSLTTTGGRCEACKGTGEHTIELGPLPDVVQPCPVCAGKRFQGDVLEVRWKGLNAAELLALDAGRALPILAGHPRLESALQALIRVGLSYVPLGQPLRTLSGGESRKLALARELSRAARRGADDVLVLLDDPSTGLHPTDVVHLVGLLRELIDEGATVWAASHDPLLVAAADAVVRLPEACG
ncbi:MAG: AAA family ATPase, partial [Myxococcales bacterium]|nr:AAA family ATPase [Myxococcales bacterium]